MERFNVKTRDRRNDILEIDRFGIRTLGRTWINDNLSKSINWNEIRCMTDVVSKRQIRVKFMDIKRADLILDFDWNESAVNAITLAKVTSAS